MFSCLQILEAFLWFVLITLLNVTVIILTLSVSRLLNLLLRLVAFLLFLNPQCLASISRWITASSSWKRFCHLVCRLLLEKKKHTRLLLTTRPPTARLHVCHGSFVLERTTCPHHVVPLPPHRHTSSS